MSRLALWIIVGSIYSTEEAIRWPLYMRFLGYVEVISDAGIIPYHIDQSHPTFHTSDAFHELVLCIFNK